MNISKFIRSFGFAFEGLRLALRVDQNVRFHVVVGLFVIIVSFSLKITKSEFLFIIFAIFFVIIVEMVNTAIEEMTNLILKEHSREAKIAKDVAAGAVLLSAIFAAIVGIVILLPHLLLLFHS
jgi:diacylglycerol kinase